MIFDGTISVKAVLQGKHRSVEKVYFDQKKLKSDPEFRYIYHLASSLNVEIAVVSKAMIDEMTGNDKHGGICCDAGARDWQSLDAFLNLQSAAIAVLQGIEDPFNYGYALRSLYASGFDAVIVDDRDWENAQHTVCKSSAGASEFLSIIKVEQLEATVSQLKECGFSVYCGSRKDAQSIYNTQFNELLVLCIGGEKRGLSKGVMALSDCNVYIPYANDFRNSLNGSSAVSVIAFEIFRQRHNGAGK
jgi:23S rRNA (guanosine2251-2'-O)-methyltransferase